MISKQNTHRLPSITSSDPEERRLAGYLIRYTNPLDPLFQPGFKEEIDALIYRPETKVNSAKTEPSKTPVEVVILKAAWRSLGEFAIVDPPFTTASLVSDITNLDEEIVAGVLRKYWGSIQLVTAFSDGAEYEEETFRPPSGKEWSAFANAIETPEFSQSRVDRVVRRIVKNLK